jgi:hypothetical protein
VGAKVDRLITTLENPSPPQLAYACVKCEFRAPGSGFDRCWGALNDVSPSAWSMPWLYNIRENGVPVFDRLARQKTVSLWDIPVALIKGKHGARQRMYLESIATNREIIKPELTVELAKLEHPLAFLDIEAYRTVVPNKGGRVGGITMFQFSLHVISAPGAEPTHFEYLDSEPGNPNPRFLAALRAALGDRGSCLCWARFEIDSFREYRDECLRSDGYNDDVLWLDQLIVGRRLVDQHALCLKFYINPKSASVSIKQVLRGVWSEDTPAKRQKSLDSFPPHIDPYTFLRESGCVSEGVGAMTGFVAMLSKTGAEREKVRQDLLRYCAVDTAAQVVIYLHWTHLLKGMLGITAEVNAPARNGATSTVPLPNITGVAA